MRRTTNRSKVITVIKMISRICRFIGIPVSSDKDIVPSCTNPESVSVTAFDQTRFIFFQQCTIAPKEIVFTVNFGNTALQHSSTVKKEDVVIFLNPTVIVVFCCRPNMPKTAEHKNGQQERAGFQLEVVFHRYPVLPLRLLRMPLNYS